MDKIEALIKKLTDFKEELNKNVNMSYSSPTNVTKGDMNKKPDIVRPDAGYGKVTVKDTGGGPPADPKKPGAYGKVIMKEDEPHKDDPNHEKKEKKIAGKIKEEAQDLANMHKDEMMMMGEGCGMGSMKMAKNGQWSMHKGAFKELEHKLEGEGKSKESAGAIAYSVGKKKYGKAGMEHKAEAARKNDDEAEKMEKAIPGIDSKHIFSMDHIKSVSEHKDHGAAKKLAHSAIESSNARVENKHKARQMVDSSKSPSHLAQGMTNFHMAHDAKVRGRLSGKKDNE